MMSKNAKRDLRNVMVFALADGKVSDEEKQFIESLRVKLGMRAGAFRKLVDQVREDRKRLSVPRGGVEGEEAVRLLVRTALADGEITPPERKLLQRLGDYVGLGESRIDELINLEKGGSDVDDGELQSKVDEIYANFTEWDQSTRRQRIEVLGELGGGAVVALMRILESYRTPDGSTDALELKTLIVEQLGKLGDSRAVYYLAQQINIGDVDDEITSAALREAASEALGRIVGEDFTRDSDGVLTARNWWTSRGLGKYDSLVV